MFRIAHSLDFNLQVAVRDQLSDGTSVLESAGLGVLYACRCVHAHDVVHLDLVNDSTQTRDITPCPPLQISDALIAIPNDKDALTYGETNKAQREIRRGFQSVVE